jgi:DNA replication licensing factor MCM2
VTIRSEVFSQLKKIIYKCVKCGFLKGPFYINNINDIRLGSCTSCQSTGPFPIDKQKTIYRNYQKITLQEAPSEVLPGRIPRSKDVILFGDNIDVARPGDYIEVTGVYMNRYECYLNIRQGFPLFLTLIEANCVTKMLESDKCELDSAMEDKILKFSKSEHLDELIYQSIAPSIYGHYNIKRAITMAMFGGMERVVEGTHRIRGDINVLLLGDPGIAKSQFLKSIQKIFYRSIYTTGKGASAVGLTASVKRDHSTNEWKLEAGALVLADKGICLIDEFDKMNEHDRTSIHEAMEQQSISISKAGIVTTLRARCSVIAAANPLQGRYNSQLSFSENIDLSDPILSRFDILNVIRD